MDREYHRNYHRNYYRAKRKKLVKLLGGKCATCGSRRKLHFDHKDPGTKFFSIGELMSKAWDVVLVEVKKCQLLCWDCHKTKSIANQELSHTGSDNPNAFLTEFDVKDIKRRLQNGESGSSIARLHRCSNVNISLIKRGKAWAHVVI